MAYRLNPNYGAPGAPEWLNWWTPDNRFMMSVPPEQQAPAPAPMAPRITPQDVEAHQAASQLAPRGGLLGGGNDGGNGMERDSQFADPTRTSASQPNTPANFSSNIGAIAGTLGGIAGTAAGIPGLGVAGGALGQMADANRYSGVLNANSVPFSPNYGSAALYGASSLPFGIGALFGTSAREQSENARREALANGVLDGNVTQPFSGIPAAAPWGGFLGADNWTTSQVPDDFSDPWGGFLGGGWSSGGESNPGGVGDNYGPDPGGFGPWGSDWGFAKGGRIPRPMPGMHDPPGPDDQIAAVQSGEGVLTRKAMKRHPGLLDALNKGDVKRARGLLGR